MQMYVNYFDRYVKTHAELPTVGIVLYCGKHMGPVRPKGWTVRPAAAKPETGSGRVRHEGRGALQEAELSL